MTERLSFTKKVVKTSTGFIVWIPKDIIDFLALDETSLIEADIRHVSNIENTICFTKKIVKSGRGYLISIPSDIVNFLEIKKGSLVELFIKKLEKNA